MACGRVPLHRGEAERHRFSTPHKGGTGWLRTNGASTNRAAEKVMSFDRLGKRCVKLTDVDRLVPKKSVEKHEICSDPISADPSGSKYFDLP